MWHWACCPGFCGLDRRIWCWQLPCAWHQPPCSSLSPDPPLGLNFLLPGLFVSSLSGCPETQNSFQFIMQDKAALCMAARSGGRHFSLLRVLGQASPANKRECWCSRMWADDGSATATPHHLPWPASRLLRWGSPAGCGRLASALQQHRTGHGSVQKPWGWCSQTGGWRPRWERHHRVCRWVLHFLHAGSAPPWWGDQANGSLCAFCEE